MNVPVEMQDRKNNILWGIGVYRVEIEGGMCLKKKIGGIWWQFSYSAVAWGPFLISYIYVRTFPGEFELSAQFFLYMMSLCKWLLLFSTF